MAARTVKISLAGLGILALVTPAAAADYVDSNWEQGQAQLERALPTGQARDFYTKKLRDMGFNITSTNYNHDRYLEYEVVKGDQSYEVQIDFDGDTNRATSIDIARNIWQTEATEAALGQDRDGDDDRIAAADRSAAPVVRSNRYSDRDRLRSDKMIDELEALPVGHNKAWYKNELKRRGYTITKVNTDDQDELQLEAVKSGHSLAFNADFDEDTGRSTSVDADTIWAESESTARVRTRDMATPTDDDEQWQQGQAQLQMALPAGKSRDFYAKKLRDLGYKVTSTNEADSDELEYEVVKGDRTYEVEIAIDEETNKATSVDIQANLWQTEATDRVVDRNQMR